MNRPAPTTAALSAAAALLLALALAVPATSPAQSEEEAGPTPEASDTYLIAKGRITFRVYCSSCHGPKGKGDGTVAELLKVKPPDLTRLAADNGGVFPRKRVHATIDGREDVKGHGNRDMPIWGEAFKKTLRTTWKEVTDEERAQLKIVEVVYFLDSIQE
ncbi:MAG: c-type cytochrome [Thermoanaerobaculia bacterium]|nr:c-type cytochrome [Thermoanaerobaculia bacterium]